MKQLEATCKSCFWFGSGGSHKLVKDIILEGKTISYNQDNPLIEKEMLYGIFKKEEEFLKIHNRIYEQRIYNYMVSKVETDVDAEM